jgi:hypothetical protein
MAYSDFTSLEHLEQRLGIKNRVEKLFDDVHPIEPSAQLSAALQLASDLPLKSEKAKSEWIIVPILTELRLTNHNRITIYSGDMLNADEEKGLKGECDFILAKDIGSFNISYPIIQVLEAKKGDIEAGIPQCAAQLMGARIYNEKKGVTLDSLYGCVTTGKDWQFLSLQSDLKIDRTTYYLSDIGMLLGIFQHIIEFYKDKLD